MIATADFETTTLENDCRVWAYAICEIGNYDNFICGNSIDEFFEFCMDKYENHILYFHNLKFDGEFIFYWLFRNGYEHVEDRKHLESKTFTTLISDKGQFYSIEICFNKKGKKTNKLTIYDSLKILNFSVQKIGKDFNLPVLKIDKEQEFYTKFREVGHILTEEEKQYIQNDVEVVARALKELFDREMNKMTIGADALNNYKVMTGKSTFEKMFPILDNETDKNIRASYRGGFTFLNERYKNKGVADGIVLDVNSLYPWVMYDCPLPFGEPIYFEGKYKKDKIYNLYIQHFKCQFELKENYIPTLQLKHNLAFIPTEYVKDSGAEEVILTLTSVDLELFLEHYNVYNVEWISGYKFKSSTDMFKGYVDFWINEKINAKKNHNGAMYTLAKLMLNSLYGKFALSPVVRGKFPLYDEKEDFIHYKYSEEESRKPIYIPVGTFITSWARNKTIRSAQKNYDRFIYADTDSLHLEGLEIPEELQIDDYILGAWKHELTFSKAKYLRAKSYMEYGKEPNTDDEEKWKITVAGMPTNCYQYVDFDNFKVGAVYKGKLQHHRVSGGVILKETEFTIKM
jgi:hypothetical protein